METLEIQGKVGTLAATARGASGTPVLFVHGNAGTRRQWEAAQAHLEAREHRSIAIDLRGHGESAAGPVGTDGYRACADDLERLLDELELSRVVLVGHSFGGAVVNELAARRPDRVAALLYVDVTGRLDITPAQLAWFASQFEPEIWPGFRERWFDGMLKHAKPSTRELVITELRAARREVVRDNVASLVSFDPAPAFERFRGPTRAVCAAGSSGPQSLAAQRRDLPRAVIDGVSHWVHLDALDAVAAALDDLLAT